MSDSVSDVAPAGSISPRNVDTVRYKVNKAMPLGIAVNDTFEAWPYGEVFAWIRDRGPVAKTSDIAEWEKRGLIERV